MTNSSVKKGPIRSGAVVPTLIIVVILGVYFHFFFDSNVRRGLEYALTHVNGAEVDVHRVRTSFLHGSLEIDGIAVTDKEEPARNSVEVGSIKFAVLWDALLRAKIVIDEASILNIQVLSPRSHPGFVLPPPPPPVKDGKPSEVAQVESEVLKQTRKQYNGNFLGDVAGVLGGADPKEQLKDLQGQLKSDAKIKELQKDLADKKAKWDQRIKALPQSKELQAYADRIKVLKFDVNNPGELAKNVQEAQKIVSEAQEKVKLIDQTQRDLKTDLGAYQQQYKDLEKMVQEDARDLQGRLKLPNIDAKEFSQQLFMTMIEKKLGGMAKYVELARHYMPAKKPAGQKQEAKAEPIIPPKRGTGHTYHFPITTGYPLFWLKHAAISSKANESPYSGDLKGEIKDVSSDPVYLQKPTLLLLAGDFPNQDIHGLNAKITLDHTSEVPKESLIMSVARFPVQEQKLSDSPDVRLALAQARGHSEIDATFINDEITMNMKNDFAEIKYDLEAKNKMVQEIIDNVLKGIPAVNVNADIKGSLHDLDIHINSNLGDELSKGFQKQLQAKIEQAKAELKKMIDGKIGGDRDQLKSQMDKMTGDLTGNMNGEKGAADKAVKDAQGQLAGKSGGGQKQLEQKGKDLLKSLHIGG